MTYTEHYIDNNGVRIHALEFNSAAQGVTLVMVPGMGNSAGEMAEPLGDLVTRRTIMLSLRGRGKSDSPATGWSLEDQASDIAAVVKHFGLTQIALFGHSTGGSIAARALPMIEAEIAAFIIGDFAPFYPPYDEGWREHVQQFHDLQISAVALAGIVASPEYIDVSDYLRPFGERLFAITGDADKSALQDDDFDRLHQIFPALEVARLEGCSHEFYSDNPALTMKAIEHFIPIA